MRSASCWRWNKLGPINTVGILVFVTFHTWQEWHWIMIHGRMEHQFAVRFSTFVWISLDLQRSRLFWGQMKRARGKILLSTAIPTGSGGVLQVRCISASSQSCLCDHHRWPSNRFLLVVSFIKLNDLFKQMLLKWNQFLHDWFDLVIFQHTGLLHSGFPQFCLELDFWHTQPAFVVTSPLLWPFVVRAHVPGVHRLLGCKTCHGYRENETALWISMRNHPY